MLNFIIDGRWYHSDNSQHLVYLVEKNMHSSLPRHYTVCVCKDKQNFYSRSLHEYLVFLFSEVIL